VIPAPFRYQRAGSLSEALQLLGQAGEEAKLLAGGQSLLPLMKLRMAAPETLVDVSGLDELRYVRAGDGVVRIGALARHHELVHDEILRADLPMLSYVAAGVGDPQVRHRGTIGGSCAHADPSADLPTALLALGARFVAESVRGRRAIPAAEFFTGFLETALEPDEVLVEVEVPAGVDGYGWEKFSRRRIDWATVAVAAVRRGDEVSVALANMASTPVRAAGVERALAGGAEIGAAAAAADDGLSPPADVTASSAYRRELARVLTRRALQQLPR
jgi:carbon-monoxide dehydrogenase medium subunit